MSSFQFSLSPYDYFATSASADPPFDGHSVHTGDPIYLFFRARAVVHDPTDTGATPPGQPSSLLFDRRATGGPIGNILLVHFNGHPLTGARLANKSSHAVNQLANTHSWVDSHIFDPTSDPARAHALLLVDGCAPDNDPFGFDETKLQRTCFDSVLVGDRSPTDQWEFAFDVTELLRPGMSQHIKFDPGNPPTGSTYPSGGFYTPLYVIVDSLQFVWGAEAAGYAAPTEQAAGTPPAAGLVKRRFLPTPPVASGPPGFQLFPFSAHMTHGGAVVLSVNGRDFTLESEFGVPHTIPPPGVDNTGSISGPPGAFQAWEEALWKNAGRFGAHTAANWVFASPGYGATVVTGPVPTAGQQTGEAPIASHTYHGVAPNYSIHRLVEVYDDRVEIYDRIAADQGKDALLRLKHYVRENVIPEVRGVTLAGLDIRLYRIAYQVGIVNNFAMENPTTYMKDDTGAYGQGLGLLPRGDVFRAHASNYATITDRSTSPTVEIGIRDDFLRVPKGTSIVHQLTVIPTDVGEDYWAFINRARRLLGTNFKIEGGFSFVYPEYIGYHANYDCYQPFLPGQAATDFLASRALTMVGAWAGYGCDVKAPCAVSDPALCYDDALYGADVANGVAGFRVELQNLASTVRAASNDARVVIYFNAFQSTAIPPPPSYAADAVFDQYGNPIVHPGAGLPRGEFIPTRSSMAGTNGYAQALDTAYFDAPSLMSRVGADGIYWDQLEQSDTLLTFEGDTKPPDSPDPYSVLLTAGNAHNLYVGFVTLASLGYRLDALGRLGAGGRTVVANGQPLTESMLRALVALRVPCFIETATTHGKFGGGLWKCRRTHLYCPVSLGDDGVDQSADLNAEVARQVRERIDQGTLYYFFRIDPGTLTDAGIAAHMFPFTPIDVRPGVLIGEDRILISTSGRFGWGDGRPPNLIRMFRDTGEEIQNLTHFAQSFETDFGVSLLMNHNDGTISIALPHHFTAVLFRGPSPSHFNYAHQPPLRPDPIEDPGGPVEGSQVPSLKRVGE